MATDDERKFVLKTAMTPEELAEYIGGSVEFTDTKATGSRVVFMKRADVDAVYKKRMDDLCERLDEVAEHIRIGNISREAESAVAWCMQWTLDQMELMQQEQKELVAWLMEANAEVLALRSAEKAARGGNAAAAVTKEVRQYAVALANERQPVGGWASAPMAAEAIIGDVRTFARGKGRRFSVRKVEEWLRAAGIKRS